MKKAEHSMEQVLLKLNTMLGKRFKVKSEFLPLYGNTSKEIKAIIETVKRNSEAPMIVAHNELIIPIKVDGVLAGASRVENIQDLAPGDISQIRETIDLILSEVLAAQRRIEILTVTEELMRNDKDNIIDLTGRRPVQREAVTH
jgi:hypothetical protein